MTLESAKGKLKKNIDTVQNKLAGAMMPKLSYVFIQCLMFFLHYGLEYKMPIWVIWFPTLVYLVLLSFILLIFIVLVIISVWVDSR